MRDIEDDWFLKPGEKAPPSDEPERPKGSMRHVTWDITIVGAKTDEAAIFAAIRGIYGEGNLNLTFTVFQESGPAQIYTVDRAKMNEALKEVTK